MKKEEFDREHLMSVHHQPVVELANEARRKIAELIVNLDPESASLESTYENALKIIEDVQTSYKKLGKHTIEHESLFKALFGEKVGQFVIEQIKRISDEEWQGRKDALILIGDLYKKHQLEEKLLRRKELNNRAITSKIQKMFEPEVCDTFLSWFEAVDTEDKESTLEASRSLLPILVDMIYHEKKFEVKRGAGIDKTPRQLEVRYFLSQLFGAKRVSEIFNVEANSITKGNTRWQKRYSSEDIETLKFIVLADVLERENVFKSYGLTDEEIEGLFVAIFKS
ncbi:TPA: hypothetical protein NJY92_002953 [Vibrio parahaemolyticus]|nr:hypothetical protein [Vibrio parahaemolyticus]HCG5227502.1 hypothetical protein [Vibrio parahaemolyticus]